MSEVDGDVDVEEGTAGEVEVVPSVPLGGYVAVAPPAQPASFVKKEIAWHMRRRNRLKFLSANRRRFKPYSLPPELTSPSLDGL